MSHEFYRKRLDDDCLIAGRLHPSVAERLHRIRELPVIAAANLLGVESDAEGTWLIWQYVPGRTLDDLLADNPDEPTRLRIARDLQHAVACLHAHGIVHGAIDGQSVIIDGSGRVRLTHFSPLLWSDPARDDDDVVELLRMLTGGQITQTSESTQIDERRFRRRLYLVPAAVLLAGLLCFLGVLWYIGG